MIEVKKKETQREKILRILSDGCYHSTLEFRNVHYIMSSGRFAELREMGHKIETKMLPVNSNDENSAKIAWYRLEY